MKSVAALVLIAARVAAADVMPPPKDVGSPAPDVGPALGGFGAPCASNDECQSGYCIPSASGPICTVAGSDVCPAGFTMGAFQSSSGDVIFVCVPTPPEPGELGAPCTQGTECDSGHCAGNPGAQKCTTQCGDGACPMSWKCKDVDKDGAVVPLCIPLADVGDPCETGADCAPGHCVPSGAGGGVCAAACLDMACPSGLTCRVLSSVVTLCLPKDAPSPWGLAAPCAHDFECLGGACLDTPSGRKCSGLCATGCGDDWYCGVLPSGAGGCVPKGGFGTPCTARAQCVSDLCVPHNGVIGGCTRPCEQDCPSGWSCEFVGDGQICIEADAPPLAEFGRSCRAEFQCEGAFCIDGRCTRPCGAACPAGWLCDPFVSDATAPHGVCVRDTPLAPDVGFEPRAPPAIPKDAGSSMPTERSASTDGGCSATERAPPLAAPLLTLLALLRLSRRSVSNRR